MSASVKRSISTSATAAPWAHAHGFPIHPAGSSVPSTTRSALAARETLDVELSRLAPAEAWKVGVAAWESKDFDLAHR